MSTYTDQGRFFTISNDWRAIRIGKDMPTEAELKLLTGGSTRIAERGYGAVLGGHTFTLDEGEWLVHSPLLRLTGVYSDEEFKELFVPSKTSTEGVELRSVQDGWALDWIDDDEIDNLPVEIISEEWTDEDDKRSLTMLDEDDDPLQRLVRVPTHLSKTPLSGLSATGRYVNDRFLAVIVEHPFIER